MLKRLVSAITIFTMQSVACFAATEPASPDLNIQIDKIMKDSTTSAAVASILKNGKFSGKPFGQLSSELASPQVNDSTYFRVGSVSKIFTTLGVLKLVEMRLIKLDDPVKLYLPWFHVKTNPQFSDQVTIAQLLGHTSGLSREFSCPFSTYNGDWLPLIDVANCVNGVEFHFAPGASLKYSNVGFAILGQLIASVVTEALDPSDSLRGYAWFMKKAILEPLGMASAKYYLYSPDFFNMAQGYGPVDSAASGRLLVKYQQTAFANTPEYYLALTLRDTEGVLDVLRAAGRGEPLIGKNGQIILSAKTLSWMTSHPVKDPYSNFSYGYGLTILDDPSVPGRQLVGHSGGAPGYRSYFFYNPSEDIGAAVMTNVPENVSKSIADVLLKHDSNSHLGVINQIDSSQVSSDTGDLLSEFSGAYIDWAFKLATFTNGFDLNGRATLDINYDGKRRHMAAVNGAADTYRISSQGQFTGDQDELVKFLRDSKGKITQLLWANGYYFNRLEN